jgi:thiamine transport system permease protein
MMDKTTVGAVARARRSGRISPLWLWLLPLAFLALFYFYPLSRIISLSFSRSQQNLLSTLSALEQPGSIFRRVFWFTLWQALISTLLTLLIGLPGAYLFARYEFPGKSLLRALTGVPFVMPTLVVAAAFTTLLGPRGWLNLGLMALFNLQEPPLKFMYTLGAILLAHVFYNTTIVLRTVGDYWSRLSPRLEQAARVLGANRWQSWWRVTLPLLMPAVASASLLVFIFDFTSFGVILILGGPLFATLEVAIYQQTLQMFNLPVAAALSLIQLVITILLMVVYTRLTAHLSLPLDLQAARFSQRPTRTPRQRLFVSLGVGLLLLLFVTPLVSLAARSFARLEPNRQQRTIENPGLTLDFYRELTINRRSSAFYSSPPKAVSISLGYAVFTMLVSLLVGLPAAWLLARHGEALASRFMDPILMLPMGTSEVTLGLGLIIGLSNSTLWKSTSPLLIPLAHTLVAFPFVVRSLTPALRSIQPRLRQAAAVLGASPRQVLRRIDLPLVGRAVLVAAIFAFTISLGEFGATALISRPEFPTISMVIYNFLSHPGGLNYGQALAMSAILMAVAAGGMLVIERLRVADIGEF